MIPPNVIVIGGVLTSKVKRWLSQLGIHEFTFIEVELNDISPENLDIAARRLQAYLPISAFIISIGPVADTVLNRYYLVHGALPSGKTKDKKIIDKALEQCKDYLNLRRFYVINSTGPRSS